MAATTPANNTRQTHFLMVLFLFLLCRRHSQGFGMYGDDSVGGPFFAVTVDDFGIFSAGFDVVAGCRSGIEIATFGLDSGNATFAFTPGGTVIVFALDDGLAA